MAKVKVSIIVPVYNAENFLPSCLDSLVNQTLKEIEIILVNDGSTDNSLKIIKDYQKKYKNIVLIDQKNTGQAIARNNAIQCAKGEYITFADSDDQLKETMLETLYQKGIDDNSDIVWCNAYKVKETTQLLHDDPKNYVEDPIKNYILFNASPWRKIIRKSLIVENELYFPKIRFYEDFAVVPAYALYANKISYVDDAFYLYMMYEGSTMHQVKYNSKLEDIFPSIEHLYHTFSKSLKEEEYREELEYLFINHFLHAASLRFFQFKEGRKHIAKIISIMKEKFPNWQQNKYYKKRNMKFKIVCYNIYHEHYKILDIILK